MSEFNVLPHGELLIEANNAMSIGNSNEADKIISVVIQSLERALQNVECLKLGYSHRHDCLELHRQNLKKEIPHHGYYITDFGGTLSDDRRYNIYIWPNASIIFYIREYNKENFSRDVLSRQFESIEERNHMILRMLEMNVIAYDPVYYMENVKDYSIENWAYDWSLIYSTHIKASCRTPKKFKI